MNLAKTLAASTSSSSAAEEILSLLVNLTFRKEEEELLRAKMRAYSAQKAISICAQQQSVAELFNLNQSREPEYNYLEESQEPAPAPYMQGLSVTVKFRPTIAVPEDRGNSPLFRKTNLNVLFQSDNAFYHTNRQSDDGASVKSALIGNR